VYTVPEFTRLGDVYGEWLRPVLVAPPPGLLGDEFRRELAVGCRDRQQLDACGFLRRSALVGVDVRRLGAHDCAPAWQHRQQTDDIGAGAVKDREGLSRCPEVPCAHLLQLRRIHVLAVGHLMAVVGVGDRGEHVWVDTRVVVGGETADAGVVQ
jgi:hypothetical protein